MQNNFPKKFLIIKSPTWSGKSMQRYSRVIESAFEGRNDVKIVQARPQFSKIILRDGKALKLLRYLDSIFLFGLYLAFISFFGKFKCLILCDQGEALQTIFVRSDKRIVMCHDFFAIEAANNLIPGVEVKWSGKIKQKCIKKTLSGFDLLACVSKYTTSTAEKLFPNCQVKTILNCIEPTWTESSSDLEKSIVTRESFCIVSTSNWRKGRERTLDLCQQIMANRIYLHTKLIIVGDELTQVERAKVTQLIFDGRIQHLSGVSDDELRQIYRRSIALIHLSDFEGFGYPLIEARFNGALVIGSHIPSFVEISELITGIYLLKDFEFETEEILNFLKASETSNSENRDVWMNGIFSFPYFKARLMEVVQSEN